MHYTNLPPTPSAFYFLLKGQIGFIFSRFLHVLINCMFFFLIIVNFIQVWRIPFNQQITNFESTLNQIRNNNGAADVEEAVAKSIFFVGMGSNDYLNNYLMPNYNTKNQYNAQEYATLLTQQYNQQLTVRFSFCLICSLLVILQINLLSIFSYSTNLWKIVCFFSLS